LAGLLIVVAVLLAFAGAIKLSRPGPTTRALRAAGLPGSALFVRLLGLCEITVAVGALALGSPVAMALVAAFYLLFAGFILVALRRGAPISSCGCFGAQEAPPTLTHLVMNLAAALVAGVAALGAGGRSGLGVPDGDGPLVLATFLFITAVAAWFSYVVLTLLPRVEAAAHQSAASRR